MIMKTLVAATVGLAGVITLAILTLFTYGSDFYEKIEGGSVSKIETNIENIKNSVESAIENTESTIKVHLDKIQGDVESVIVKADEEIKGYAEKLKGDIESSVENTDLQTQDGIGNISNINKIDSEEDESIEYR